jgi:hypothetical protein
LKAVDLLAEAEKGLKDELAISQNRMRRRQAVERAGGH